MFLRNRKKNEEPNEKKATQDNWAIVILKPLRKEVRENLLKAVSDQFSMSADEAANVIENTPNILLDQISQKEAVKIKDGFRWTGAEMFLTNDDIVKAKCFRTVWPEPKMDAAEESPASFEENMMPIQDAPASMESEMEEDPFEVKQEIHFEEKENDASMEPAEPAMASESDPAEETELDDPELDAWKRDYDSWKETFGKLQMSLEGFLRHQNHFEGEIQETRSQLGDREKGMQEQRDLIKDLEKKYEESHQEYNLKMSSMKDRMAGLQEELSAWKLKAGEATEKLEQLDKAQNCLVDEMQTQQNDYDKLHQEYLDARIEFEQKASIAAQEMEHWKQKSMEADDTLRQFKEERESMMQSIQEQHATYEKLEKDFEELSKFKQGRDSITAKQFLEWKTRESRMTEKLDLFEKVQMQFIMESEERRKKEKAFEKKTELLDQEIKELKALKEQMKKKASTASRSKKPRKTTAKKS